jgi:hypothetical protein
MASPDRREIIHRPLAWLPTEIGFSLNEGPSTIFTAYAGSTQVIAENLHTTRNTQVVHFVHPTREYAQRLKIITAGNYTLRSIILGTLSHIDAFDPSQKTILNEIVSLLRTSSTIAYLQNRSQIPIGVIIVSESMYVDGKTRVGKIRGDIIVRGRADELSIIEEKGGSSNTLIKTADMLNVPVTNSLYQNFKDSDSLRVELLISGKPAIFSIHNIRPDYLDFTPKKSPIH